MWKWCGGDPKGRTSTSYTVLQEPPALTPGTSFDLLHNQQTLHKRGGANPCFTTGIVSIGRQDAIKRRRSRKESNHVIGAQTASIEGETSFQRP
jgi:hypothetical protein